MIIQEIWHSDIVIGRVKQSDAEWNHFLPGSLKKSPLPEANG